MALSRLYRHSDADTKTKKQAGNCEANKCAFSLAISRLQFFLVFLDACLDLFLE